MFDLDCLNETKKIEAFIKETLFGSRLKKIVIGISGGLDSAVTLALIVRALGRGSVIASLLPCGNVNKTGLTNGRLVIKNFDISDNNIVEIDIKKAVETIAGFDKTADKLRLGNITARVRMIYLYDLAKKHRALVCGTENRSEHLLGYFTKHGDEASDFEPIRHLYKTEILSLAKYLKIPQKILNESPTAGFWHGQTDEKELGFTYKIADEVLHLYFDRNKTLQQIADLGYEKNIIKKVIFRAESNSFKINPKKTVT